MNMVNKSKRNLLRPMVAMSTALLLTCVLWMAVSAGTPLGRAGYLDFSYSGFSTSDSTPTGEKPESKLWWNDGFWWGSMFDSATQKMYIYRLNWGEQVWEKTNTMIDDRLNTKADTLFVDDPVNPKLYVASHVFSTSGNHIVGSSNNRPRLYRYSYSRATQTYTLDAGFPVTIGDDRVEAMTIGRDNTVGAGGRLWITYVSQDRATPTTYRVFVNATTTANNDLNWGAPTVLPTAIITATRVASDDMSAVVVTNGKVVVVWNNAFTTTTKSLLNVAYRSAGFTPSAVNGADWSLTQVPIPAGTDDHINLKSLQANGTGQIFAAIKTSAPQTGPSVPHIQMVAVDISGTPTYTVRTFTDNLAKDTRPIVMLDEGSNPTITDDKVYLFVTGSDSGSKICYGHMDVELPLSNMALRFKDATNTNVDNCGTSFIEDSVTGYKNINNATSMKGSANSTTGIVILASDHTAYTSPVPSKVYVHNVMGNPPPVVTTRGPGFNATGVTPTALITATFSKPMSATTISGTTFKVRNATGPVAGTVTYNASSRTAAFVPATPLQANTVYTVELTNGMKDSSNLTLGGDFRNVAPYVAPVVERWKFTTSAASVGFAQASYSVLENVPSAVVTVTLNATSTTPISVTYTITNGTAQAGEDYTAGKGLLVFAPNQRANTFSVPILDNPDQGSETVNLLLSAPVNGILGVQSTAQLIIVDNDGQLSAQFGTVAPVLESAGAVNIQVTLSNITSTAVSIDYKVSGGTATGSTDYNFAAGTLSFPANTATASFPVTINDDLLDEADETILFELFNPSATIARGVPGYTTTLTILDNDLAPSVKFASDAETAGEADGVKQVTVNLTAPSGLPVTVVYATSNLSATAPADYAAVGSSLTFNPGEVSKPISVTINNDDLNEESESFGIALLDATNATRAVPFNTAVTINDNDPPPTISFAATSVSKNENGGTVLVTVNLSAPSGRRVIVDYAAANGTATAGQDFGATQGQLIFAPGETSQPFEVPLLDDTAAEGLETVNLTLNNPVGAQITDGGNAILTIIDNESAPPTPVASFSSTTYQVTENAGSATVTVNLNVPSASAVTVNYATSDGTATAGSDYTASTGQVTFAAGEMSKSFIVPINNDAIRETNETVLLKLSSPSGATLGTADATLTIVDDDQSGAVQVAFSSATYSVSEQGNSATITVTLSAPAASAVTVNYATANGTATAGAGNDYLASSGTLTFNTGETRKTFTVSIVDDSQKESNETVTLTLTGPSSGATLGATSSATLTIIDNETSLSLYMPLIRKP